MSYVFGVGNGKAIPKNFADMIPEVQRAARWAQPRRVSLQDDFQADVMAEAFSRHTKIMRSGKAGVTIGMLLSYTLASTRAGDRVQGTTSTDALDHNCSQFADGDRVVYTSTASEQRNRRLNPTHTHKTPHPPSESSAIEVIGDTPIPSYRGPHCEARDSLPEYVGFCEEIIDFYQGLDTRDQAVVAQLSQGENTLDIAQKLKVSRCAIYAIRNRLTDRWQMEGHNL
jgi:DNA-binding NarL/FixJ family response regulator